MRIPELVPVLTPGRHRNPRKGACLMELTSHLAGEEWSDHPRSTHPLLGEVARQVNDLTGDDARQELALLAPDLVGLHPADRRATALVARECALAALAADPFDGYAAAVALLRSERVLARLAGRPADSLTPKARGVLDGVEPGLRARAQEFVDTWWWRAGDFEEEGAPAIVRTCLSALADASIDPDRPLVEVLERCIGLCRAHQPARTSATMSRCTPRSSSSPDRQGPARAGSRPGSGSPS
jgi:hypothetical protein